MMGVGWWQILHWLIFFISVRIILGHESFSIVPIDRQRVRLDFAPNICHGRPILALSQHHISLFFGAEMEKHIKCLTEACQRLGIGYDFIDNEQNFLRIQLADGWEYFKRNHTPFNTAVIYGICEDKMHTYALLNSVIRMPKTRSFIDLAIPEKHRQYLTHSSTDQMLDEVETDFDYPLIIKKNSGSLGIHVYLCQDRQETNEALQGIFNQQSKHYDYLALAQEFVPTAEEYRLVCGFGQPLIAYWRGHADLFNARYWDKNETAAWIEDPELNDELYQFVKPVFEQLPRLGCVGFDIIRGQDQQLYLIEMNSSPRFDHFIANNGAQLVTDLYEKLLRLFCENRGTPLA